MANKFNFDSTFIIGENEEEEHLSETLNLDSNNNSPNLIDVPMVRIQPPTPEPTKPDCEPAPFPLVSEPDPLPITPKKKIFPPPITPVSDKLTRKRFDFGSATKIASKLAKSVTENRLLDEVIALKGELNASRISNEELKSKEIDMQQEISELKGEKFLLKNENTGLKLESSDRQRKILELLQVCEVKDEEIEGQKNSNFKTDEKNQGE